MHGSPSLAPPLRVLTHVAPAPYVVAHIVGLVQDVLPHGTVDGHAHGPLNAYNFFNGLLGVPPLCQQWVTPKCRPLRIRGSSFGGRPRLPARAASACASTTRGTTGASARGSAGIPTCSQGRGRLWYQRRKSRAL